jgi:SAM-dependent methyltransferase
MLLRNPALRSAVERALNPDDPISQIQSTRTVPRRDFIDRHGVRHPLDPALRSRLKPSWRTMVDPVAAQVPPTDEALAERSRTAAASVAEANTLVATVTGSPLGGRVLEVGCYDGAAAFQLARLGASVVASDLARYYVIQRPGEPTADDVELQQERLTDLRERVRVIAGASIDSVDFVEDDVTASALPAGTFDGIISFEVLEHVASPEATFSAIHRLLKPGGVAFHDYNPFFSLIGGHSLCTLDFEWGHARLDAADFERYLIEIRPSEVGPALRFFRECLNRMTLPDLRGAIAGAGLEVLAVIPWFDRSLIPDVSPQALDEIRRNYPTATVEDLLATFVAVVVRKPAE